MPRSRHVKVRQGYSGWDAKGSEADEHNGLCPWLGVDPEEDPGYNTFNLRSYTESIG